MTALGNTYGWRTQKEFGDHSWLWLTEEIRWAWFEDT
jgi:hypothetical protein